MRWLKTVAITGTSIMLMGSKIVITVPQGGSVVSSSGLMTCSAGEVCIIDIAEHHFVDTFTAVPEQGYYFASWENASGGLCRGSLHPQCPEPAASAMRIQEGFRLPPDPAAVFTLNPAFAPRGAVPPNQGPRFTVNSSHLTRYYDIDGDTADELRAQLAGDANPLPVQPAAGRKPVGHANFSYRYDYSAEYGGNLARCRIASATLRFHFETVLPRLRGLSRKPGYLRKQWLPFQREVIEHEAGHHAIYRLMAKRLPRALTAVGEVPCNELDQRVGQAVGLIEREMHQASSDYDFAHRGTDYLLGSL